MKPHIRMINGRWNCAYQTEGYGATPTEAFLRWQASWNEFRRCFR